MENRELVAEMMQRNRIPGIRGGRRRAAAADDDEVADDSDSESDNDMGGLGDMPAMQLPDDLRADLEERQRQGNAEGWMTALLNMFRRPDPGAGHEEGGDASGDAGHASEERDEADVVSNEGRLGDGPLPGAWPEDEDDDAVGQQRQGTRPT